MNSYRKNLVLPAIFIITALCINLSARAQTSSEGEALKTAEGVVTELYRLVTFEAGSTPDWEKVKSTFIDEAVVVLRTSRTNTTVFSVEGFVNDFVTFTERPNVKKRGFEEKIISMKPMVFGDMAHILVLFEAHIPGAPKPPQQGADSFQLIKKDGRWWIVAVINEIPTQERPIPAELQE